MLLSSVIAKPVLEADPSNIHDAGLANEVEGLFGEALNAPRILPNKDWLEVAIVD